MIEYIVVVVIVVIVFGFDKCLSLKWQKKIEKNLKKCEEKKILFF